MVRAGVCEITRYSHPSAPIVAGDIYGERILVRVHRTPSHGDCPVQYLPAVGRYHMDERRLVRSHGKIRYKGKRLGSGGYGVTGNLYIPPSRNRIRYCHLFQVIEPVGGIDPDLRQGICGVQRVREMRATGRVHENEVQVVDEFLSSIVRRTGLPVVPCKRDLDTLSGIVHPNGIFKVLVVVQLHFPYQRGILRVIGNYFSRPVCPYLAVTGHIVGAHISVQMGSGGTDIYDIPRTLYKQCLQSGCCGVPAVGGHVMLH